MSTASILRRLVRGLTALARPDRSAPARGTASHRRSARHRTVSADPWCGGAPFDLDLTADELLRDLDPDLWRHRRALGGGA